jgi:hypothetical protein
MDLTRRKQGMINCPPHEKIIYHPCATPALNLAHQHSKHGEIPLDETLELIDSSTPSNDLLEQLCNGMENLVGVLGNICSGLGHEKN